MNGNPSAYGGVAAVLILGLGLLLVGFNFPEAKHDQAISLRWAGAAIVVFGLMTMAFVIAKNSARKALCIAITAVIYCGMFAYNAVSNEITGTATYRKSFFAKGVKPISVTRTDSPTEFRVATNVLWGGTIVCLAMGAVSLIYYRANREA